MALAPATAYDLTDEQRAIIEMVHEFVDNEIIPVAEEYDAEDKFPEPIVEQMKEDEAHHRVTAERAGAAHLPAPVRLAMRLMSKVMTTTAYRI